MIKSRHCSYITQSKLQHILSQSVSYQKKALLDWSHPSLVGMKTSSIVRPVFTWCDSAVKVLSCHVSRNTFTTWLMQWRARMNDRKNTHHYTESVMCNGGLSNIKTRNENIFVFDFWREVITLRIWAHYDYEVRITPLGNPNSWLAGHLKIRCHFLFRV